MALFGEDYQEPYSLIASGFTKLLNRVISDGLSPQDITPEMINSITDGIVPKILQSGELTAKISNVEGYLQSSNYVAHEAGWRINADGTSEFQDIAVRSQKTHAYMRNYSGSLRAAGDAVIYYVGSTLVSRIKGWWKMDDGVHELNGLALKNDATLKAYYRLEADGTDSSGNGKTLTATGSPTYVSGLFGNAVRLPLNTSYLGIADNMGITGGACSLSIWIKQETEIGSGAVNFVSQGDASTDTGHAISYEYNGGTRRIFFRRAKWNVEHQGPYYTIALGTTNWTHIVYTYDGTNVRGYVNGALVAGPTAASGNGGGVTTDNFSIYGSASGAVQQDDVAIFSKALSLAEIQTMYSGFTDSSGNNNTLTTVNSPTSNTSDKMEGTASIDFEKSSSQYAYCEDPTGLNITGGLTIALWAKPESISNYQALVSSWEAGYKKYTCYYDVDGRLRFGISADGTTESVVYTNVATVGYGMWQHFAFVFSPSSAMEIYKNGTRITTNTITIPSSIKSSAVSFQISGEVGTSYYDGLIDNVFVLDKACTADEVNKLMNNDPTDSGAVPDGFTTTASGGNNLILGMCEEAIPPDEYGNILLTGFTTELRVNGTADIAVGDFLSTYTSAGIAKKASAGDMVFAIAYENYTANDSSGVIDALLITPRKV